MPCVGWGAATTGGRRGALAGTGRHWQALAGGAGLAGAARGLAALGQEQAKEAIDRGCVVVALHCLVRRILVADRAGAEQAGRGVQKAGDRYTRSQAGTRSTEVGWAGL